MVKFKFHSSIEDILIEEYIIDEKSVTAAVQKAAESDDFDLNDDKLEDLAEKIYSSRKYW